MHIGDSILNSIVCPVFGPLFLDLPTFRISPYSAYVPLTCSLTFMTLPEITSSSRKLGSCLSFLLSEMQDWSIGRDPQILAMHEVMGVPLLSSLWMSQTMSFILFPISILYDFTSYYIRPLIH